MSDDDVTYLAAALEKNFAELKIGEDQFEKLKMLKTLMIRKKISFIKRDIPLKIM